MIMNSLLRLSLVVALLPAALVVPQSSNAQEEMREGRTYVGVLGTRVSHRSVDETKKVEGWSTAAALVIGTHVSEFFHAELRMGTGVSPGEIDQQLKLDIDYFASWYFGGHYPVTRYANAYAQFGFTHVKGESSLTPFGRYRAETAQSDLPEELRGPIYRDIAEKDYPGSSFSVSWIIGMDFEVVDNGFLFVEGGKLFEDTETNANVFQFSLGAKYEF
jgi:opacity protein-like surface antigen